MSKLVVDGDTVTFETTFGEARLMPPTPTTTISGTGSKLKSGAIVCVEGDQTSVKLIGVSYTTKTHTTPGTGSLRIERLGSDQTAQKLTVGGKKAILVGTKFDATFTVDKLQPATLPQPQSTPDSTPSYSGKGSFSTRDTKLDSA